MGGSWDESVVVEELAVEDGGFSSNKWYEVKNDLSRNTRPVSMISLESSECLD